MASVRMVFDLVLITALPPNHSKVFKVDTSLDCSHQCMANASCQAMVFNTVHQACYIYTERLHADPSASVNTELMMYNSEREPDCNGIDGQTPVLELECPVCPTGSGGYTYNPEVNVCFKLHSQFKTQHVSEDACTRSVPSGLLRVDTQEKKEFFMTIMPPDKYAYVSGHYMHSGEKWVYYEDGIAVPMSYIGWADGQPNGLTRGQHCLALNNEGQHDVGKVMKVDSVLDCAHECMREATCEAIVFITLHVVCGIYQGVIQAEPWSSTGMELLAYNFKRATGCSGTIGSIPGPADRVCPTGSGYSYKPALNICFKHLYSQQNTCIQDGASGLLMIDSQEKQDFFKTLLGTEQYTYIRGDRNPSTGEWAYWDEGTARPMPFIGWSTGQPNGAERGQNCLALDSTGQHDAPCNMFYNFFCEYTMK